VSKEDMFNKEMAKALIPYDFGGADSHRAKAKERFYRRLKESEHVIDKEMAFNSPGILEQLSGTSRIHKWLEDPAFAQWWWDEHSVSDELMALRHKAVARLSKIVGDDGVSASDMLKAVRMIFEVTDQFPGKKQEIRFLDEDINRMSDTDVDKEMRALVAKLGEDE
jgi:hypothetical protein